MRLIRFVYMWLVLTATLTLAQSNPVPFVNQPLVPMSTAPGGADFTLTINGTGFVSGAVVDWNGTQLTPTFFKNTQLTATVPASLISVAGTATVKVINPAPGGGTSNIQFFGITVPSTSVGFNEFVQDLSGTGVTPNNLVAPVIADFNNDGKQDLAFTATGTTNYLVCIELGNGDTTFQAPSCVSTSLSTTAKLYSYLSMLAGDFNGDGNLDIVLPGLGSTVSIFLGNGNGTLQPGLSYPAGPNGVATMVAADFNGDGNLDLAVMDSAVDLSILLGNGDGTFQNPTSQSEGLFEGSALAVGDFNKDGKLDLAFATVDGIYLNPAFIALGNGDGTFQTPEQILTTQNLISISAAADINGDGNPDLVFYNFWFGRDPPYWLASWTFGNGDGTFGFLLSSALNYPGGFLDGPLVADINGDGTPDLVLAESYLGANNFFISQLSVLYGTGTGPSQNELDYPSSISLIAPSWLGAADFNGDGKSDAVVASSTGTNFPAPVVFEFYIQGDFPAANLSATSLSFPAQTLGVTSTAQIVTLTNTGLATLAISSISISGTNASDFGQSNTCGSTVAINASCQISVKFTPMAAGTRTAVVTIADNGVGGGQQTVSVTGTTLPAPLVQLSPASIAFPGQYLGTSGLPQTVTITNTGDAALAITGVATSPADFGSLNACGSTVAAGSSCAIGVFFDPTTTGTRTGTLTVTDNAAGSPQTVALSGSGEDFSIAPSGSSTATVSPGQTASYTLSVAPAGGFNQTVTLSCSGEPAGATCSFSPSSITLNGSSPSSVTVTVPTAARAMSLANFLGSSTTKGEVALLLVFGWLCCMLMPVGSVDQAEKVHNRQPSRLAVFCLLAFVLTWSACGGSSAGTGGGTTSTTYSMEVTGSFTSGSTILAHTTKLTLIVQ